MPRNRFEMILSNLHVNDNQMLPKDNKDKACKIRPMITEPFILQQTFIEQRSQMLDENKEMGARIDLADQLRSSYCVDRKSRKWWHRLFWGIDIALVNAYFIYNDLFEKMDQLEFRRSVAVGLLAYSTYHLSKKRRSQGSTPGPSHKRRKYNYSVLDDVRLGESSVFHSKPVTPPKGVIQYGNLYAEPNATVGDLRDYEEEPDILLEEVQVAIDKLREGKAAGLDRISANVLQALDNRGHKIMHTQCQKIWKTGLWPEDWPTSILLPLHKKGPTTVCDNYRLIALISHSSKIMLYILQARLQAFLTHQIASEQAGFVKGLDTREQILNARQLIEKAREYSVPIYLYFCTFVDYEKAFDNVRPKLWTTLGELGVSAHLITLVKNLY
ncbi:hypothetical protein ILUMI_03630 [Ignelater luminosus]|uniref:Reverse transcriptase domain-containing protein n=1 Tax=Ignelater luminosus TaxID=2038154 RepID=A0A8K0DAF0_IGNLU|nr:hypothetical protein ILUMI_03630 [Ignelater luminosus]